MEMLAARALERSVDVKSCCSCILPALFLGAFISYHHVRLGEGKPQKELAGEILVVNFREFLGTALSAWWLPSSRSSAVKTLGAHKLSGMSYQMGLGCMADARLMI